MDKKPQININGVDIKWDTEKGTFTFFDTPSALFWINPSLLTLLEPLKNEIGRNLFCLEVAASASLGTEEDYYNMVNVLSDSFEQGFLKWGEAVSTAGWGTFEIVKYDLQTKTARVKVSNTWELLMQKDIDERWGCPFIQGKIIGIFSHAFETSCWAKEILVSYDPLDLYIEFEIFESNKTISTEIEKERLNQMQAKERLLADQVALKTKEVYQAKVEAESASLAKSKFLASMSHELITPLNAIIGFGNLLTDMTIDKDDEEYRRNVQDIVQSGTEMLALVEQILNFSQVSLVASEVETQEFSPIKAFNNAILSVKPIAEKRDISINALIEQNETCKLIANEVYLTEILIIFLLNAIKYTPKQSKVEIHCFSIEPGWQRFMVKDNGSGIPTNKTHLVFRPFERLNHQNGAISGAGVGLSIAKMMSLQMGGKIDFKNNSGLGASFWIDLPKVTKN